MLECVPGEFKMGYVIGPANRSLRKDSQYDKIDQESQ
jgi:hypothetical protein